LHCGNAAPPSFCTLIFFSFQKFTPENLHVLTSGQPQDNSMPFHPCNLDRNRAIGNDRFAGDAG